MQKSVVMRIFVFLLLSLSLLSSQLKPTNDFNYQLIIFEGSDWCTNCAYLSKTVLEQDEFQKFLLSKQIELIRVDFPQRHLPSKEQQKRNANLAEKYNFEGVFPTLVLVKSSSEDFREFAYQKQNLKNFKAKLITIINQFDE